MTGKIQRSIEQKNQNLISKRTFIDIMLFLLIFVVIIIVYFTIGESGLNIIIGIITIIVGIYLWAHYYYKKAPSGKFREV